MLLADLLHPLFHLVRKLLLVAVGLSQFGDLSGDFAFRTPDRLLAQFGFFSQAIVERIEVPDEGLGLD
jgi:hypothetical protein